MWRTRRIAALAPSRSMLRLARLLTWRRARAYALVLVLLYAVAWVYVVVEGDPPLNSGGVPISGDYIAFHAAGRLVLSGRAAQLYDHAAISSVQQDLLGGRIAGFYDAYRNPPFFALPFVPLAALDLLSGFVLWTALSLGCLALSLRLLGDEVPWVRERWRGLLVLIFAFAPVYFDVIDGENALVSLLLYVLLYRALARRQDALAGVWAALGLFKPQLFFLFPLVFVATRRWRALLTCAATAAVLLAVSVALVGIEGLQAWLRVLLEPESGNSTVNGWRMTSLKSFFDALISGQTAASLLVYSVVSVALVGALLWAWSRGRAPLSVIFALTCLVAVLVDPHLVDYDLTVLVAAGVVAGPLIVRLAWAVVPLYLVTLLRAQIPIGDVSLQLTPLLLGCCALALWRASVEPAASLDLETLERLETRAVSGTAEVAVIRR